MCSRSSGLISASMNASISASSPGRCSGRAKSTVILLWCRLGSEPVQCLLPDPRECGDGVVIAEFEAESGRPDEDRGEVLEQQRDRRRGVLGMKVVAVAL